jgi:RNA polymerase sigma factor (sigma-70 family)
MTMVSSATFESDVALAASGDEAAYARLVEQCATTVCSIALALVRSVDASEDVAQEVFLITWTNLKKLRNPASFLPWLRQVTRNQARVWLREHRREVFDEEVLATAVDGAQTADRALLRAEEQRLIREALSELPADAREVVILYYREGSSLRHVAELLGITEDAAKQRLSRARTRLRNDLLERMGGALVRSAPGAAFTAMIGGAMATAAPTAAAAATLTATSKSAGLLGSVAALAAKSATLGAASAAAGVFMSIKHLEPFFDEEEASALRRFRTRALLTMAAGATALSTTFALTPSWHRGADDIAVNMASRFQHPSPLVALLLFVGAFGYLYGVQLPRILERRMAWERSVDPQAAEMTRKQWMSATMGNAVGALFGGLTLLFLIVRHCS